LSTVSRRAFDVRGRIKLTPDADSTNRIVDDLIRVNKAELPTQWRLENYSPARRAALVPHIIGFEFEVTKLEPKLKLTQPYGDADRRGQRQV
jgi:transcriptional regulator